MATTAIKKKLDAGSYQLKDQVVAINRVTKVVKGGKNMSFAALVVVGDPSAGVVGFGPELFDDLEIRREDLAEADLHGPADDLVDVDPLEYRGRMVAADESRRRRQRDG